MLQCLRIPAPEPAWCVVFSLYCSHIRAGDTLGPPWCWAMLVIGLWNLEFTQKTRSCPRINNKQVSAVFHKNLLSKLPFGQAPGLDETGSFLYKFEDTASDDSMTVAHMELVGFVDLEQDLKSLFSSFSGNICWTFGGSKILWRHHVHITEYVSDFLSEHYA